MSWMNELYQVYEKHYGRDDCQEQMLPVSHSTSNAQIEITLKEDGDIVSAKRLEKEDAVTIIPVTDDSGARSSGICPHPYADKLCYIAGDYGKYATGKNADNSCYFEAYMKQLEAWHCSEYTHPAVNAVYTYLSQKHIIEDLIRYGVLIEDETTHKLDNREKLAGIVPEDAFVRFRIQYDNIMNCEERTWLDKTLYESFIAYNAVNMGKRQLCYATGKILPCTYKHPSKIRHAGDKAKLISTNDESGFAYRGRFDNKEQALSVSYDFSQKMHNALKWLIARQGVAEKTLMILVWESQLNDMPDITKTIGGLSGYFEDDTEAAEPPDTRPAFKNEVSGTLFGRRNMLKSDSKTMILLLDSATVGRVAINLYMELQSTEFLENLQQWHEDISWYRFSGKLKKLFIDSFSLRDIAECAYGVEQGDFIQCKPEQLKEIYSRMIPCEIERRNFPRDIAAKLVERASKPLSYEKEHNWRRVLETTCGILKRKRLERYPGKEEREKEGERIMALDHNLKDRSYLYGRLLAVADRAEYATYDKEEDKGRITNAKRYWSAFAAHPFQTWAVIEGKLIPYFNKLSEDSKYHEALDEIMDLMSFEEFQCNEPLDASYLLGYHCQRLELEHKGKNGIKQNKVNEMAEGEE